MEKVTISRRDIDWPRHCAECLGHPGRQVRTSISIVTGALPLVGIIPNRWLRARIEFPVCEHHFAGARLAAFLSRRNLGKLLLVTTAALWLVTVCVASVLYLLEGRNDEARELLAHVLLPGAVLVTYGWSQRRMPVRIVGCDESSLTLAFANPTYAAQFRLRNRSIIL